VHPTFLYELIWDLIVAVGVVVLDRRLRLGHGRAFALYVAGYAFGRFFIELMRSDEATKILGVRVNVWTMTLLFILGVIYFVLARGRGPREDPALFPGVVDPAIPADDLVDAGEPETAEPDEAEESTVDEKDAEETPVAKE
jgi:prolipoprotein diacylglyceryltransferase